MNTKSSPSSVCVIGGGLSGLAAATALCSRGFRVELFEARRQLGGRAGSFYEENSDQLVDHCQHVGMGCCTNLADFCRRTGIDQHLRRDRVIRFIARDGRRCDLRGTRWLPAPLHLLPALWGLKFLRWKDRLHVATTLLRLAREPAADASTDAKNEVSIGDWLNQQGVSAESVDRFWSVVLVSALGETVERASLSAARKVFVDGFMSANDSYEVLVPSVPLGQLYGNQLIRWLVERGVTVHQNTAVRQLVGSHARIDAVTFSNGRSLAFDDYILAVPWRKAVPLLAPQVAETLQLDSGIERIQSSPITAIHLWLDRPIMDAPHAVLIDCLAQWVFSRPSNLRQDGEAAAGHYYQVVISASRQLAGRPRDEVLREIMEDLSAVWPTAAAAEIVDWRMVTQRDALFSAAPGLDRWRPEQQTDIPNLMLAGDWTRTGWPSTMEGAVRSGYLAAEAVLRRCGRSDSALVDDLPRGWLTRLLW